MVAKKKLSEYQEKFRACIVKKNQAAYLENLNFRHERRDREFMHTPLCCEELSDGDEAAGASDSCDEVPNRETEVKKSLEDQQTQYQSLAEIIAESREKAEALRKQRQLADVAEVSKCPSPEKSCPAKKVDTINFDSDKKDVADKSYSIDDIVDKENKKLHEKLAQPYVMKKGKLVEDISDESDTDRDMKAADRLIAERGEKCNLRKTYTKKRSKESSAPSKKKAGTKNKAPAKPVEKEKPHNSATYNAANPHVETFVPPLSYVRRVRRPDRQAKIPKSKSRPVSAETSSVTKPPFFSYGAGDQEDNLAVHRTYNVLAPSNVYSTALRAKMRRDAERRSQSKKQVERAKSCDSLLEKLSSASPRDPREWESEYQKQFHGYTPTEYERAVSARAVIPRAAPVRAVHRGGCLVVHVD